MPNTQIKQGAGLFRRLGAWLYDALVVLALLMFAAAIATGFIYLIQRMGLISLDGYVDVGDYLTRHPIAGMAYSVYLALVIATFYAYFWCRAGQTLGMRAWRLRVQNPDGTYINLTQALVRMATSAFGLGNFMVLFADDSQSFQDKMAQCEMLVERKPTAKNNKGA